VIKPEIRTVSFASPADVWSISYNSSAKDIRHTRNAVAEVLATKDIGRGGDTIAIVSAAKNIRSGSDAVTVVHSAENIRRMGA